MGNLIIILGGNGRLGSCLIEYFLNNKNNTIVNIDILENKKSKADINLVNNINQKSLTTDIQKIAGNKKVIIINASGLQHSFSTKDIDSANFISPKEFIQNLVSVNLNFFFVQISSISATFGKEIIPEVGHGQPINFYGQTKLKFEQFLLRFLPQKNYVILRPGAFYGDNFKNQNFAKFINLLQKGIFLFPSKKTYRSYTHIDTMFSALQIILNELSFNSGLPVRISNITDNNSISTLDLFYDYKKESNHKKPPIIIPTFVFKFISKFSYFIETKLKIHINLLTMISEQGYDFTGEVDEFFKKKGIKRFETKF